MDHASRAVDLWRDVSEELLKKDMGSIYERLADLVVELDEDPLLYGPKRINEKIYQCRRALEIVEQIGLGASQRLHEAKRSLRANSAGYELAQKYLYASDPEVRAGRSLSDREALAAMKLRGEWTQLRAAEQEVEDYEAVLIVIKAKRSDLKDASARLRDQMRLCATEIDLGGSWGSAVPGAAPIRGRSVDIDDVFLHLDEEIDVSSELQDTPPPQDFSELVSLPIEEPVQVLMGEEEFSDSVLDDLGTPPLQKPPEEDNVEDILEMFK